MRKSNLIIDWKNVFNSNINLTKISDAIDIFFLQYDSVLTQLEHDLNVFQTSKQTYTFPLSNVIIAKKMRLLVIYGLNIIEQITPNDYLTLVIKQFYNNDKFVTPDVFFYVLSLLNEVLIKMDNKTWFKQFIELIKRIETIGNLYSDVLQVDLITLDMQVITSNDFKKLMKDNK